MKRIHRLSFAAACAAAAAYAPAAHACSKVMLPGFREGARLIATATPDTVLAGPGLVEPSPKPEQTAMSQERGVYGQVVRLERVGGIDTAALPGGVDRAVLVPWGYDDACRPTVFERSARWAQPGERGLFWAELRPREEWVDSLPTFDVHNPYVPPYSPRTWSPMADSLMSIEQVFDLMGLLPRLGDVQADPEAAYQPLLAWASGNPRLARLYPASGLVNGARESVRHGRLKRLDPPLAGTYRLSVTVDGGAPRTFYARTRSAPHVEWNPGADREPPAPDDPFAGYMLIVAGSTSADSLPVACRPDRQMGREGHFSVAAAPEAGPDGVRVWRGRLEPDLAARVLPGDVVLAAVARARLPEEPLAPARFLLRPDGSVAVEQTLVLEGRTVVITGERISRVTIPDPGMMRTC